MFNGSNRIRRRKDLIDNVQYCIVQYCMLEGGDTEKKVRVSSRSSNRHMACILRHWWKMSLELNFKCLSESFDSNTHIHVRRATHKHHHDDDSSRRPPFRRLGAWSLFVSQ